jgi:hypothetical protein
MGRGEKNVEFFGSFCFEGDGAGGGFVFCGDFGVDGDGGEEGDGVVVSGGG